MRTRTPGRGARWTWSTRPYLCAPGSAPDRNLSRRIRGRATMRSFSPPGRRRCEEADPQMAIRVFLSYAPTDAAAAQELADDLERVGASVWLDRDLRGGQ